MSLIIGLDVGWSLQRRTCGVAIRPNGELQITENDATRGRIQNYGQAAHVVALNYRDVARSLAPAVRAALRGKQRVVVVTDAIVGVQARPPQDRRIDQICSANTFYRRAQSYPATQQSGVKLSETLHAILAELIAQVGPVEGKNSTWTPFFGGDLPEHGIVVVETNPTTAMALCLEPADPDSLPTRRAPKVFEGRTYRAKSDWYWRSGAGGWAAGVLGDPAIVGERDHERVAGLWCLALASQFDKAEGMAVLLGGEDGVYLAGPIHHGWREAVNGHVVGKFRTLRDFDVAAAWPGNVHALAVVNAGTPPGAAGDRANGGEDNGDGEMEEEGGDLVWVRFNDIAGLNLRANPWLEHVVAFPVRICLHGERCWIPAVINPFAGNNGAHQFTIGPTVMQILQHWGRNDHPNDDNDFGVWGHFC